MACDINCLCWLRHAVCASRAKSAAATELREKRGSKIHTFIIPFRKLSKIDRLPRSHAYRKRVIGSWRSGCRISWQSARKIHTIGLGSLTRRSRSPGTARSFVLLTEQEVSRSWSQLFKGSNFEPATFDRAEQLLDELRSE